MDHYTDLRSEMVSQLLNVGIHVEMQHHEVGTIARPRSTSASTPC